MEAPIGKLGASNDYLLLNGNITKGFIPMSDLSGGECSSNANGSSGTSEFQEFLRSLKTKDSVSEDDSSSSSSNCSTSSEAETKKPLKPSTTSIKEPVMPTGTIATGILANMAKVTMDDEEEQMIGNLDVRHFIEQSFLNQILPPDLKWQACLLAGIPGCGKSRIMKSCAINVAKIIKTAVSVFTITAGELMNKYYGQSEKSPKVLYDLAKLNAPSIVIIDEIDGVMRARSEGETDQSRRFKTSLLGQMQGVEPRSGILTICSTNRGADLDPAFLRRFDKIFCIEPPGPDDRVDIFRKFLKMFQKTVDFSFDQIDFEQLSINTEGYTGDDIKKIVALAANRNCRVEVNGNLELYDDVENFRESLEKSPNRAKIVPVGLQTCDLLQAAKEIHPTYKMSDIKEMANFKRDCKIVSVVGAGSRNESSDNSKDKTTNHGNQTCDSYDEEFCGCLDKICNPC